MNGININTELEIFRNNLTAKPFCRNYKNEPPRILPKLAAINFNHIQSDHPDWQNYFVVDVDTNWLDVLENTQIRPNLLVSNKENARAHLFFRIEPLCKTKYGRIKPIKYAAAIEKSLSFHLNGDPCFNNQTAKNPLKVNNYKVLSFRNTAYSFSELHDYIDLSKRAITAESNGLSRNCDMFDIVRYKAYQTAKTYQESGKPDLFFNSLLRYAETHNNFKNQLSLNEIRSIVRSVAKWTFKNYDGSGKVVNRGRDKLAFLDHLSDKQTYSAIKTNKQRKEATESKIKRSLYDLKLQGKKLTLKAISEHSGLHRNTLAKYKNIIEKAKNAK